MSPLLLLFGALRLAQQAAEAALSALNRRYAVDPPRLATAGRALDIAEDELAKAVAYSGDRYRFGTHPLGSLGTPEDHGREATRDWPSQLRRGQHEEPGG